MSFVVRRDGSGVGPVAIEDMPVEAVAFHHVGNDVASELEEISTATGHGLEDGAEGGDVDCEDRHAAQIAGRFLVRFLPVLNQAIFVV